MTFAELKAQLDKLTPEQLAHPILWWGEERGGTIDRLLVLGEDYVSFGEGMEPWSGFAGDPNYPLEDADAVMVAGTPVLCTDEPDAPHAGRTAESGGGAEAEKGEAR